MTYYLPHIKSNDESPNTLDYTYSEVDVCTRKVLIEKLYLDDYFKGCWAEQIHNNLTLNYKYKGDLEKELLKKKLKQLKNNNVFRTNK